MHAYGFGEVGSAEVSHDEFELYRDLAHTARKKITVEMTFLPNKVVDRQGFI
jgi:hypothetical protein